MNFIKKSLFACLVFAFFYGCESKSNEEKLLQNIKKDAERISEDAKNEVEKTKEDLKENNKKKSKKKLKELFN